MRDVSYTVLQACFTNPVVLFVLLGRLQTVFTSTTVPSKSQTTRGITLFVYCWSLVGRAAHAGALVEAE